MFSLAAMSGSLVLVTPVTAQQEPPKPVVLESVTVAGSNAIPLQDFFRAPQIRGVSLSPDGKTILGIRVINERDALVAVDLATKKALILTNYKDADVIRPIWLTSDRIGFALIDRKRGLGDQVRGPGFFAIDKNGESFRQLVEQGTESERGSMLASGASFVSRIYANATATDELLMSVPSYQARGVFSSTVYRVNSRTGRNSLASLGGPDNALVWVASPNGTLRAALSNRDNVSRLHIRESESAPWRVVYENKDEDYAKAITPLSLDAEGRLLVSAYNGSDMRGIFRLDVRQGSLKLEPLFSALAQDLNGSNLIRSAASGKIYGITYEIDRPSVNWFDRDLQSLQAGINKVLPDTVNRISGQLEKLDGKVLIQAYSDRDAGRYLIYDRATREMVQVAVERPWLDSKKMGKSEFFRYDARDGLSIPAILTTPPGSSGKKLPLVVMHYGGPWARAINYGFDENVQFLASRGYAVLMPAPRASTDWGLKHFSSGFKQWGLAMQDDVTDGVLDLVKKGVVDPDRVCIAGASYGGYMTMMGLVKEPKLFKCGVNWVGVTDPAFMFTVTWTDFNRADAGVFTLKRTLGDPDLDRAQFDLTSPVKRAKEITQPVLMAYGGLDQRVPIINGEKMRDALSGHNKGVEWVVYPDEGHGWLRKDNVYDFWRRVERFLAANIGSTSE
jgi:dipeptidyl aminopeptidase/acylaminoacyl peptidase